MEHHGFEVCFLTLSAKGISSFSSVVPALLTFESSKLKYSERNDNLVSYEANVLDWYFKKKGSSHLNNVSELHQIRCICTFCSITFLFLLLHSSLLFERFLSWISVPLVVWEYILKVLVDLGNKVLGFSSEMRCVNIWCLFLSPVLKLSSSGERETPLLFFFFPLQWLKYLCVQVFLLTNSQARGEGLKDGEADSRERSRKRGQEAALREGGAKRSWPDGAAPRRRNREEMANSQG